MNQTLLRARYRHILFFFARVIAGLILWEVVLPRLGFRGRARRTRPARLHRIAARFRALAISMGGVMIKVGQFLSARVDVMPPEITDELAGLQDEVPPEDFAAIRALAEAELGARLEDVYASFEQVPLAAASLGQVHRAVLHPADAISSPHGSSQGAIQAVVVKVQRPHIDDLVDTDLAALRRVAGWVQRYPAVRRRANVPALVAEFDRTTHEELDYLAEGRNAETFAANLANRPGVRVPQVGWSHTTRRVLTLEDVYAIKITDYAAITAAGIDRAAVAHRLFEVYLQQIFEDGFFHADPHPGNLFVEPLAGREWWLTFVDFGMVGRVPPNLRAGLRELVIGVGTQDAARLVKAYQMIGVLLPGADLELLEQAEARLFSMFWGKSMSELRNIDHRQMMEYAGEFRELLYDMPFQVPQDLLMLGRTVAILSGMCTGLDPDFNLWQGLAPYAEKLIADEAGIGGWRIWLDEIGKTAGAMLTFPQKADRVFDRLERGGVAVQVPELSRHVAGLERSLHRLVGGIVFAALLLGGVQLYLARDAIFAAILLGGSVIAMISLLAPRRR